MVSPLISHRKCFKHKPWWKSEMNHFLRELFERILIIILIDNGINRRRKKYGFTNKYSYRLPKKYFLKMCERWFPSLTGDRTHKFSINKGTRNGSLIRHRRTISSIPQNLPWRDLSSLWHYIFYDTTILQEIKFDSDWIAGPVFIPLKIILLNCPKKYRTLWQKNYFTL